MKFVAHKIDTQIDKVTAQGARVGDQILWSKHNKANGSIPHYLTSNKLYTVIKINNQGNDAKPEWVAQVFCDDGSKSSWTGGEYDVITQAERFYVPPNFPGCELRFDTFKELDQFVQYHGKLPVESCDLISMPLWTAMKDFRDQCYNAGIR